MNNGPHITEEVLNEYLDGLLETEERAALESHLEHCTGCSEQLAELYFVFQAMDELPEVTLVRDLQPEILKVIISENTSVAGSSQFVRMDRRLSSATFLIFIIQVIATGFLAFFAIPSIPGRLPLPLVQQYSSQAQEALVLMLRNSQSEWRHLWDSMQAFLGIIIRSWEQSVRLPGWLNVSSFEVIVFLSAVTLLWIVMNRWLLWRRKVGNYISIWL